MRENTHLVYGPPGCGKTTWIASDVRRVVEDQGPQGIMISSFTRAAAAEIVGRDLPVARNSVGTLHSFAYRSLGFPELVADHLGDWNERQPSYALTIDPRARGGLEDAAGAVEAGFSQTQGDKIMAMIEVHRAKGTPLSLWPMQAQEMYAHWRSWKKSVGLLDFTDLIEYAARDVETAPGRPRIGWFDEMQDFTPLELSLVRHWGEQMDTVILVGDEDQCHPPESPILTANRGWVRIVDLDPSVDRLISFDKKGGSEIRGGSYGYEFEIADRPYRGPMLSLQVGHSTVRCTPNHLLVARWSGEPFWCTYLMRRGENWRVGMSVLIRRNGERGYSMFGPGFRARVEGADELWVLSIHDSASDAAVEEAIVAATYGLPQTTFTPSNRSVFTQDALDRIHDSLQTRLSGLRCLLDHGLEPGYPLWDRESSRKQRGAKALMHLRAANVAVLWRALTVPVSGDHTAGKVEYQPIDKAEYGYHEGRVYSLDVKPYHHYICDGVVVHNCLYQFKGARAEEFLDPDVPEGNTMVLEQSYRVPVAVHAMALHWIEQLGDRRQPKVYRPRDFEGSVRIAGPPFGYKERKASDELMDEVIGHVNRGKTVMIMASTSYLIQNVRNRLRDEGVPFHNPWRRSRGDWNPLRASRGVTSAQRLLAYLTLDERIFGDRAREWTGEDVRRWSNVLLKEPFRRGATKLISGLPDRTLTYEEVAQLFDDETQMELALEPNLDWFRHNLNATAKKTLAYPLAIVDAFGAPTLAEEPKVIIGTIHSLKGSQADVVYLSPDLAPAAMREITYPGSIGLEAKDATYRMFYVGMTRAREELVICSPATGIHWQDRLTETWRRS